MNSLKIGIGGVRGVVGETFTPEPEAAFAQAFGTYLERLRYAPAVGALEIRELDDDDRRGRAPAQAGLVVADVHPGRLTPLGCIP
ncbi:MAG TPA: hypothetical protein VF591_28705 [Pyrinomonadaceae bacterium]